MTEGLNGLDTVTLVRLQASEPGATGGMDWCLEDLDQVPALRHALSAYLFRHASTGQDQAIEDAELVAAEVVNNGLLHTDGPAWVSLTWSTAVPVLRVYDIGAGFTPDPHRTSRGRSGKHSRTTGPNRTLSRGRSPAEGC